MLGRLSVSLVSQDPIDTMPRPLPLADDQLEPPSELDPVADRWHGNGTSYVPGLNCLSNLFLIWHQARYASSQPGVTAEAYLAQVQHVIDNFPPELRWRGGLSRPPNVTRRHDVQIANLFITSLHIRSNLIQKFGLPNGGCSEEHQRIVDDLLEILYHLPQAIFNANGSSLVPKIRDIGAAYLEQVHIGDTALGHQGQNVAGGSPRDKLEKLLRKLDDLDCWQGVGVVIDSPHSSMMSQ